MPEAPAVPPDASALPEDIVQALAIANANSIGAQPAILANLALANQIFTANLQQQALAAQQQATNLIVLALVAKCVRLILAEGGKDPAARAQLQELLATLKSLQSPPASSSTPNA